MHMFIYLMKPKVFIKYYISLNVLFLLFHSSTWFLYTKNILDIPMNKHIGDLSRLSYDINSIQVRPYSLNTLPMQHIESKDWNLSHVNMLTIGDSFSSGVARGVNSYYSDFIATQHELFVVNTKISNPNLAMETVISWLNSGFLDNHPTDAILIESVERSSIDRISKHFNWQD